MSKLKVYCLPYAGGSKSVYNDWISKYSDVAEIVPIEYNGHGELFCEPFYNSGDEAANDICKRIMADKPENYAVFGHSMGSAIALLVVSKLEKMYSCKPKVILVGGMRPPHLKYKDEKLLHLPKDEMMKKVFSLGQTDAEIMNEPELIDILYDICCADLKIDEEINSAESISKLTIPMICMTGSEDDEAPEEDMREWQSYTDGSFYFKSFIGDHFFPFNVSDFAPFFREQLEKADSGKL